MAVKRLKRPRKKRHLFGTGYLWFRSRQGGGRYDAVVLTTEPHGQGAEILVDSGKLGGWQKIKLYAEYVPVKG